MLIGALVFTVLGFVSLVVAVATGQVAFAWVCIFSGIAGVALLLVDGIRARSRRKDTRETENVDS